MCLISNRDETEKRKEIEGVVGWCQANNFFLKINNMKELLIDFRKWDGVYALVSINGVEVEMVESFKFLCVNITNSSPIRLMLRL